MPTSMAPTNHVQTPIYRRGCFLPTLCFLGGLGVTLAFWEPGLSLGKEDSFEYLRGAASLATGRGFLAQNGEAQTLFPPGYPLAVTAIMFVTGNPIGAAVCVSTLALAASVTLVFLLARQWLGTRTAVVAAVLFAFMPLRVWASQSVLSDPLMSALVLAAFWAYTRQGWPSIVRGVVTGLALGWAYLTRPEALIPAFGLLVLAVFQCWKNQKSWALLLSVLSTLLCVSSPYVLWLHAQTGRWTFSGKVQGGSHIRIMIARTETAGDVEWRSLSRDRSTIEAAAPELTAARLARHYFRNLLHFKGRTLRNLGVEPLAGLLVVLGALSALSTVVRSRDCEQGALYLVWVGLFLFYPLALPSDRFVLQFAPLLILCLAAGVRELTQWLRLQWEGVWPRAQVLSVAIPMLFLAAILGSYLFRLWTTPFPEDQIEASKALASVIRGRIGPREDAGVIGEYPGVAYFAGVRHEWSPYADLTALREYATHKRAFFLVFSPDDVPTPATARLLAGDFSEGAEAHSQGEVQVGPQRLMLFGLSPAVRAAPDGGSSPRRGGTTH